MAFARIFILALSIGGPAFGSLLTRPSNTADVPGTLNIVLECSSDRGGLNINWTFAPFSAASASIVVNGEVTPNTSLVYSVTRPEAASCNLVINELSSETSGFYSCIDDQGTAQAILFASPYSISVRPLFGPIGGGTNVAITGDGLYQYYQILKAYIQDGVKPSVVYFGKTIATFNVSSSFTDASNSSIVASTPAVDPTWIGQPLPIVVGFPVYGLFFNVSFNRVFTYYATPMITGFYPDQFIVTGGIVLTVSGSSFSSVAEPLIRLTIEISRNGTVRTTDTSEQNCSVVSGTVMLCPMPSVDIPADFQALLDGNYNPKNDSGIAGKRRRSTGLDAPLRHPHLFTRHRRSINGPNGIDTLDIYLGFIFYGDETHENIPGDMGVPGINLGFFSPPEIPFSKEVMKFDSSKDEAISIKGQHMTRGCRAGDYRVLVGNGNCKVFNLSDNLLRCVPPKTQPQITNNDSIYCDQSLAISISIGNKRYQYACLQYSTDVPNVALIVGLTVGLSVFVLLLAVTIFLLVRCSRRRRKGNTGRGQFQTNQTQQSNKTIEVPDSQSRSEYEQELDYVGNESPANMEQDNSYSNKISDPESNDYLGLYSANNKHEGEVHFNV